MNKKIFISGPISGITDFNFPKFHFWKENLESIGYDVVSPADMALSLGDPYKIQNDTLLLNELKNKEIEELRKCDSIFMLNGWTESAGSKNELLEALKKNMEIIEENLFTLGNVLFGGAFNPLTNAHVSIIRRLLDISDNLIVAVTNHDYKEIDTELEFRLLMLSSEFKNEIDSGKIHLVVQDCRTWEFLHKKEMNNIKVDYLALGEDEADYLNMGLWHHSHELKSNYKIFKIKRSENSISSTKVRKEIFHFGLRESLMNHIPKSTFEIIKSKNLYETEKRNTII